MDEKEDKNREGEEGRRENMLKFLNRSANGEERLFGISVTSVRGGAMVELTMKDKSGLKDVDVMLTPMDAALLIEDAKRSGGISFSPVGHSEDGADMRAYTIVGERTEWYFVGAFAESCMAAGGIKMLVPRFVIHAIRIALEGMMTSLMYPTTGDMEEEFG